MGWRVVSRARVVMSEESGKLLTAAQVAQRLGFTERYVWKLGREGAIARVKLPGRKYVRFCEADVERFVRDGRREAQAHAGRFGRSAPSRPLPSRY